MAPRSVHKLREKPPGTPRTAAVSAMLSFVANAKDVAFEAIEIGRYFNGHMVSGSVVQSRKVVADLSLTTIERPDLSDTLVLDM